jgi:hypothetical protein
MGMPIWTLPATLEMRPRLVSRQKGVTPVLASVREVTGGEVRGAARLVSSQPNLTAPPVRNHAGLSGLIGIVRSCVVRSLIPASLTTFIRSLMA